MGKPLDLAYMVGALLTSPVWGLSLLRTGKWRTDWRGRFGYVDIQDQGCEAASGFQKTLLIHAVSVGEVNLIRNLVDHLTRTQPNLRIVISTTTNTGFTRATQLYAEKFRVVRFPFDFSGMVVRFLEAIKPDAVALTELEVWPNFMQACVKRNIPVAVVNGRLSTRSFKGYRKLRPVLTKMFASLSFVAAQTEDYAQRFRHMGVPADRVKVLDTMKWDTAQLDISNDIQQLASDITDSMVIDRDRPVVVLGSSGDNEEVLLTKAILDSCTDEVQIIIVPRKPERFESVYQQLKQIEVFAGVVRRSSAQGDGQDPKKPPASGRRWIYLIDRMGELRAVYLLADVVIVGRSFNGWGGSDPIEPVALGKPTLIGPDHHNFADAVAALKAGGGIIVTDKPGETVKELLNDPAQRAGLAKHGREVILSRQGATKRHAEMLLELLDAEQP